LKTSKIVFLPFAAFFLGILFYISYNSLSFIFLSQILWFYQANSHANRNKISSFLILNGLILLVCLPWILFIAFNYKSQPLMEPYQEKLVHSFWEVLYWMIHDWTVHLPLMILSIILLALLLIWSKHKKNAGALCIMIFLPVTGTYLLCKLMNINHFISSRYFINFLPLFFILLYLSLSTIESKFEWLKISIRPNLLFLIFVITSNLVILPLYYKSEKMNLRGLANYLKIELKEGDKIFDSSPAMALMPGLLHYFRTYPKGRHYVYTVNIISKNQTEFIKSFSYGDKEFTVFSSSSCCNQYIRDGSRIWFISDKPLAVRLMSNPSFVLKGFFDGSFSNLYKFPADESIYLFLLDPKSLNEKGLELPIE